MKNKVAKIKNPAKPELDKMLIENFVNLQKVLTNLSIKFDSLSEKMSKLLQLFEISAKSFVEKQIPDIEKKSITKTEEKNQELLEKLDILLEQNKTIARGLTLIEERLRERPPVRNLNPGRPRYPHL